MPKVLAFWGDVEASSLGLTYANGQGVPRAERAGRRVMAQGRRPAVRRRAAQPRSSTPTADAIMVGTAPTHMRATLY